MYPKKKTYLRGYEFQCCRILRGRAIEDIPTIRKELEVIYKEVLAGSNCFSADGKPVFYPTKHRETWDVIRFTASGYFNFNGERVAMKQITDYNPTAGTFQTPDGVFTLYPLPTA